MHRVITSTLQQCTGETHCVANDRFPLCPCSILWGAWVYRVHVLWADGAPQLIGPVSHYVCHWIPIPFAEFFFICKNFSLFQICFYFSYFASFCFGFGFVNMHWPREIFRVETKLNLDRKLTLNNSKGIPSSEGQRLLTTFITVDDLAVTISQGS